jgi:polygalacturonase
VIKQGKFGDGVERMRTRVLIACVLLAACAFVISQYRHTLAEGDLVVEAVGQKSAVAQARMTDKNIQVAIDLAAVNGGGDVNIPAGKYYLANTIIVKSTVKLRLDSGSMLIPTRNVNVIELRRNSAVSGGIIYAHDTNGFDQSAIYLNGSEQFSGTLSTADISDMKIIGPPKKGNGIFFYAARGSDHVSWVQATNLNIAGFEKSIYFKTEPVQQPDKIWINGNNFSQILIKDSLYGIYLDGHRDLPYEISGNTFTNVQIQTTRETKQAIYVKGTKNVIQAMIWDYHQGAVAVHFDEDSLRNQIQSNVSASDSAYQDEGTNNLNLSADGS